ncbi:Lipoprotein-releasing system ATP-binding protein LolD [compost metagenome]
MEDTDIAALNEEQLAVFRRRKVGLIYQFYNLIPTLDVRKNILLPMLLDNRKPDEERFAEITGILGLTGRLSHLPSQLSGGQQQRVAIARSLIYRPAILLADEPTGNLDRKNSEETMELLKLSNKRFRQTVLLITHDERLALEADRILVMEDGRIVSDEAVAK